MVAVFVILTVLFFVSVDWYFEGRRAKLAQGADAAARRADPERVSDMPLPAGYFLHRGHMWAMLLLSGRVKVGIDDLVRHAVGRPDSIRLRAPGETVKQGEPILELRSGKRVVSLGAPLSGTIATTNDTLTERPGTIGEDPYQRGWACILSPHQIHSELCALKIARQAKDWLDEQFERYHQWLANVSGQLVGSAVMQDGGERVLGVLHQLDGPAWEEFQKTFLNVESAGDGAIEGGNEHA